MGSKIKIACVIFASLLLVGCEDKVWPPPTITVNEVDSASFTEITVTYNNHYYSNQETPHIVLSNPEQVAAYKEQVEFLLNRLDEAERRMNIHEPEPTPAQ